MKILVKKTYCNNCQKLVMGREQKSNGTSRIVCPKCGHALWVWNGLIWRGMRETD